VGNRVRRGEAAAAGQRRAGQRYPEALDALPTCCSTGCRCVDLASAETTGAGSSRQAAGQRQRLEGAPALAWIGAYREIWFATQTDSLRALESIRSFSLPDRTIRGVKIYRIKEDDAGDFPVGRAQFSVDPELY